MRGGLNRSLLPPLQDSPATPLSEARACWTQQVPAPASARLSRDAPVRSTCVLDSAGPCSRLCKTLPRHPCQKLVRAGLNRSLLPPLQDSPATPLSEARACWTQQVPAPASARLSRDAPVRSSCVLDSTGPCFRLHDSPATPLSEALACWTRQVPAPASPRLSHDVPVKHLWLDSTGLSEARAAGLNRSLLPPLQDSPATPLSEARACWTQQVPAPASARLSRDALVRSSCVLDSTGPCSRLKAVLFAFSILRLGQHQDEALYDGAPNPLSVISAEDGASGAGTASEPRAPIAPQAARSSFRHVRAPSSHERVPVSHLVASPFRLRSVQAALWDSILDKNNTHNPSLFESTCVSVLEDMATVASNSCVVLRGGGGGGGEARGTGGRGTKERGGGWRGRIG